MVDCFKTRTQDKKSREWQTYFLFRRDDFSCRFASWHMGMIRSDLYQMPTACSKVHQSLPLGLPCLSCSVESSMSASLQSGCSGWLRYLGIGLLAMHPQLFFDGVDADPVFMLIAFGYQRLLHMIPKLARQGDPQVRDIVFSTIQPVSPYGLSRKHDVHTFQYLGLLPQWTLSLGVGSSLSPQFGASGIQLQVPLEHADTFIRRWSRLVFHLHSGADRHYSPPQWFLLHSSYRPP